MGNRQKSRKNAAKARSDIKNNRIGERQKTVVSETDASWAHYAIWGAVCAVFLGIVFWIADLGAVIEKWQHQDPKESYYNLLVQGFDAGQLNLKMEVPPAVAKLRDPYEPTVDPAALVNVVDLSYYKGKLYLYFGVTPVLVLFWPYAILTGHYLSDKVAVAIFFGLSFGVATVLMLALRRRYFPQTGDWVPVASVAALGTALALTLRGSIYEASTISGFAFVMLALAGIWQALDKPQKGARWVWLASLAYGLAVGSRPSLVFGVMILLVPAVQAWRQASRAGSRQKIWPLLVAAVVPAMLIGSGLMLYNDLRFGNPLEFGWHYLLNTDIRAMAAQQFNLHYLWFNVCYYFFGPIGWNWHFPFLQQVPLPPLPSGHDPGARDVCGGIVNIYPALLLALAAPLAWRGRPELSALRWFAGAVFLLFVICALTVCLYMSISSRYALDFLPPLIVLAMMGILGLDRALANSPIWRGVARGGWCVLLAYSVAFNLLASFESRAGNHCLVGNAFFHSGRLNEAMVQYQKAQALWPGSADALTGLGSILFEKGDIDGAIAQYQKALEIKPDAAKTRNNLGLCLYRKGRVDDAIAQYQMAIQLQPESPTAYDALGNIFSREGDLSQAVMEFQKALDLKPDLAEAEDRLAGCFLRQGRTDEAIVHYQKAIELQPAFTDYHNDLGNAFFQAGRLNEAILQLEKSIEINPKDAAAENNLGFTFAKAGRASEAIQCFQRALKIQRSYQTYYNLAHAYRLNGDAADAKACYLEAIELQPRFFPAQADLAWLLATWPDRAIRDGNQAIGLAEQAGQLSGAVNPEIFRSLAAAYAETGQFPQAVAAAKQALALAQAQANTRLSIKLQAEISLYQNNTPCRSTND